MLWLFACSAPTDSPEPRVWDTATSEVSPPPDPAWTAEAAAAKLAAAFELGLPDPDTVLAEFLTMFEGADELCPTRAGDYDLTLVVSTCTSLEGWTYSGVSGMEAGENGDYEFYGDCFIEDAAGQRFECAGELERASDGVGLTYAMTGTWGYEGSATPWMAPLPGMALWITFGPGSVAVEGSYGIADTDLWLDIALGEQVLEGELRLRDPGGAWYRMVLDGTDDGCGTVSYGGAELGRACVPMLPALDDVIRRSQGVAG